MDARILENGEEYHKPERDREVANGFPGECAPLGLSPVSLPVRLVGHVVFSTKISVQDDHGNSAEERESCDDGTNPKGPGICPQVLCNDVCG